MRPPEQLVAQIAQAIGPLLIQLGAPPQAVGPAIADFLSYVARQAGEPGLVQVLRMEPQALAQLIAEFAQSPAGGGSAPPPADLAPPMGAPNATNPAAAGPGPVQLVQGPPQAQAQGAPQPPAPLKPRPKKTAKRKDAPERWSPPELPKPRFKAGPTMAQCLADAREGRDYFAELTEAITSWHDIYHMADEHRKLDGRAIEPMAGEAPVTRAQPVTMASRVVGLTAPSIDRLGFQVDPWDDEDETTEAAQAVENYARYFYEELTRRYGRKATMGDFQPPLPRKLSGLAAIEGGFAFRLMPNPDDKQFPWSVDVKPMLEIFARPRATTHQVECSLAEAWTYDELAELLPAPDKDDPEPLYSSSSRIRLVTWTDETHWCMCAEWGDTGLAERYRERHRGTAQEDLWIQKPVAHGLGRRIFLIPNPWDATPLGPNHLSATTRARHLSRGIYAPVVPTIKAINQIAGALRSGLFKAINPPMVVQLNPALRAQHPDVLAQTGEQLRDAVNQAGGVAIVGLDEKIGPALNNVAASADGQAFLQSLMGDLNDIQPPVMGGRGAAQSGFDRFQASEAAGVVHVDPIIAYLTGAIEYLLEAMLTDLARLGEGDKKLFTKLPYRSYRAKRGTVARGGGMATLDAKAIRRNGPRVTVTYRRESLTEQMQIAQLNMMLVKEHMKSRLSAMDDLGIDDTERERAQMLAEAALEDPAVVKAAIKVALQKQIEGDENNELDVDRAMYDAYLEAREKEAQAEAAKGMRGLPSPPGAPPGQPPMPGSSAPGLPPVMQGAQ